MPNAGFLKKGCAEKYETLVRGYGFTPVEPYAGYKTPRKCTCPNNHTVTVIPVYLAKRRIVCNECPPDPFIKSRTEFIENITCQNGELLEPFTNPRTWTLCRCEEGHEVTVPPDKLTEGQNFCFKCTGIFLCPVQKEFYERIEHFGANVTGHYRGVHKKTKCLCIKGHECLPCLSKLREGKGICSFCAGNSSKNGEIKLTALVAEMSGKVIGNYVNVFTPVKCECKIGHEVFMSLANIRQRKNLCDTCSGRCPKEAEKRFREKAEEIEAKIVGNFNGAHVRTEVICKNGHTNHPYPFNIVKGRGFCKKCAKNCPEEAERNFRESIKSEEGIVVGKYVNNHTRVECKCKEGHKAMAKPNAVQQGYGFCSKCKKSLGEKMVEKVLNRLDISYEREVNHPKLRLLRFDFRFSYKNITVYFEHDGIQHQREDNLFHRDVGSFLKARQRDLVKNYICSISPNTKLIRTDHTWVNKRRSIQELEAYIVQALESVDKVIANPEIYTWINDLPTEETKRNYLVEKGEKEIREEEEEDEEDWDDIVNEEDVLVEDVEEDWDEKDKMEIDSLIAEEKLAMETGEVLDEENLLDEKSEESEKKEEVIGSRRKLKIVIKHVKSGSPTMRISSKKKDSIKKLKIVIKKKLD